MSDQHPDPLEPAPRAPAPPEPPEAASLDAIEAELAASEDVLRDHLAALLAPPPDLTSRTTREVTDALLHRSTLAAAVDTVTVGWHTVRILFGTDSPEDRS